MHHAVAGPLLVGMALGMACTSDVAEGGPEVNDGDTSGTGTEGSSESSGGTNGGETGESSGSGGVTACEPGQGDCTNPAPICGAESTCQACEVDTECAAEYPGTPACNDGSCVECTASNTAACETQTPVCNTDLLACEGCTSDEQCQALQGTNCNLSTGACFSDNPAATVRVRPDPGPDDVTTLAEALERLRQVDVDPEEGGTIILYPGENDNPYLEGSLTIDFNLDLQGAGTPLPVIQGSGGPSLVVAPGVTLRMEEVQISGNLGSDGVEVQDGASLTAARSVTVSNNAGVGVSATGGIVDIIRSRIVNNDGGGIALSNGATMSLVNSFVAQSNNDTDAVSVGNESSASILYSSLSALVPIEADARALVCGASAGVVTARNSLFVAAHTEDEVECATLQATRSASEMSLAGDGNVELGDFQSGWFESLAGGNLLLDAPPAALLTTARWLTDDPTVDIDGDERFTAAPTNDTPDVAGADSLAPVEVGGQ